MKSVPNVRGSDIFLEMMGRQNKVPSQTSQRNDIMGNDLICYCFGYTERDIRDDYQKNGQSLIMKKIMAEKKAGACRCAEKNPRGR